MTLQFIYTANISSSATFPTLCVCLPCKVPKAVIHQFSIDKKENLIQVLRDPKHLLPVGWTKVKDK